MNDLLYHGTSVLGLILRDKTLRRAQYGYECVSLTRSYGVARYFASMDREDGNAFTPGIICFRREDLIKANFNLIPFHDEFFGAEAADEEEEQVWADINLDGDIRHQVDRLDIKPWSVSRPRNKN